MNDPQMFRWIFVALLVTALVMSGYCRHKARMAGGTIPRAREGSAFLVSRLVFGVGLYLPFVLYMVNPEWMRWSFLPLPNWLRWIGGIVGAAIVPLLWWVLRSLGANISETFLTKQHHELVVHGPYRWVRHPLYAAAALLFVSLGLVASNWFIIGASAVAIVGISVAVIPKEEAALIQKFGEQYREYQHQVGMLLPRFGQHRVPPTRGGST